MKVKKHPFFGEINFNDPDGVVWEGKEELDFFRILTEPGTYIDDDTLNIFEEMINEFDDIVFFAIDCFVEDLPKTKKAWEALSNKYKLKNITKDLKKFLVDNFCPTDVEFYSESVRQVEGSDTALRIIGSFLFDDCRDFIMIDFDEETALIGYSLFNIDEVVKRMKKEL